MLLALMVCYAVACAPRTEQNQQATDVGALVITNVHVVPMDSERVLRRHAVVVRRGVIEGVGPEEDIAMPADARQVDGRGAYVLPGLADMHVHLRSESELPSYVAHGVTTVAHLSGTGNGLDPLRARERVAAGELLGPAILTSGPILDGNPPIFSSVSTVVTTASAATTTVAGQLAAGFDFIKIYNNLEPDVAQAVISAAHTSGRAVFGHIPRRGGRDRALQRALDAGLDVIAHAEEYFFTFFYGDVEARLDRGEIPHPDTTRIPIAVELTRDAGATVIPNLSFVAMTRQLLDSVDLVLADPETRYLSARTLESWRNDNPTRRPDAGRFDRREQAKYPFVRRLTKALSDARVPLLLGTDASAPGLFPGRSAHLELRELVAAGLTPFEALATGTRNAGRFVRSNVAAAQAFGVIARGNRADLILVRGNPLDDIGNAARIEAVVLQGQWLPAPKLALMRDERAARR